MEAQAVREALARVSETDLARIGRVAERLLAGRAVLSGGQRSAKNRAGRGFEFLEHSPYAPGDEIRALDWRASARSRRPQVRRFLDESSSRWFICVDQSGSMGIDGGTKWLLAIQIAAAWAYLLLRAGHQVGLLSFHRGLAGLCSLGRGRHQYRRVLDFLLSSPVPREGKGTRLEECANWVVGPGGAAVISDFLAPDVLATGLDRLLAVCGEVHAIQTIAKAECGPLPPRATALRDVESGEVREVRSGSDAAAAASDGLVELRQRLCTHCRRRRIPLSVCRTDRTWNEVVFDHLRTLYRTRV